MPRPKKPQQQRPQPQQHHWHEERKPEPEPVPVVEPELPSYREPFVSEFMTSDEAGIITAHLPPPPRLVISQSRWRVSVHDPSLVPEQFKNVAGDVDVASIQAYCDSMAKCPTIPGVMLSERAV